MPTLPSFPPKPISRVWRPELTRLPDLHPARRIFRNFIRRLARVLIRLLTHAEIRGIEYFPRQGPGLIVINHLGDADAALLLAALPVAPEALGKVELHDFPVLGWVMDGYGIIWLHRGKPDRRALRCAMQALSEKRFVLIAPEGRYTLTGGLEQGGPGAAWLALATHVPVIPVALTGTENAKVYGSLRHFKRPRVTLSFGKPLYLGRSKPDRRQLERGSMLIMRALAAQLPPNYRGVYEDFTDGQ